MGHYGSWPWAYQFWSAALVFSLGRVQVEMSLIIMLISGDELHSLIYILMKNYQFLKRPEGISTKLHEIKKSNV